MVKLKESPYRNEQFRKLKSISPSPPYLPIPFSCSLFHVSSFFAAGRPREVTRPGLPQIRTCAIDASGSSYHGFAT